MSNSNHKYETRLCIDCGKELLVRSDAKTIRCKECRKEKRRRDVGAYIFCKNCGEEFKRRKSSTRFCSSDCAHQYRKKAGRTKLFCDWCGKSFDRPNCHVRAHNFCSVSCKGAWESENRRAENHPNWSGGTYKQDGYIFVHLSDGSVMAEHRYVMECVLGRKLYSDEVVHHIDRDKTNNHPSNLVVLSRSEHAKIHADEIQQARHQESLEYGVMNATVYWTEAE